MTDTDIVNVRWDNTEQETCGVATFSFAEGEDRLLQVTFATNNAIVRVLDEMPLSTEDEISSESPSLTHFAYRVRDAFFYSVQSEVWKQGAGSSEPIHYRFITGQTCLDVISFVEPELAFIDDNE